MRVFFDHVSAGADSPKTRLDRAFARFRAGELDRPGRQEEIARMLGGAEVTAKTRANAREFLEQNRRRSA